MNCDTLPNTGVWNVGPTLVIALLLLISGALVLSLTRSRRAGGAVALLVVLIAGATITLVPGSPAHAATSDCVTPDNSLTITQTSTMQGLAPGIAAVPITGKVVNNGTDSTFIVAITVDIISVTGDPGASPGVCDPSDFTLLGRRMPVGQTLGPGGSTTFTGATIGFNNKTINQDACKRSTIHLRYVTSP